MKLDFVGRTIGNWELLRPLGEGGFGAVYEAHNVNIAGRRAAIKVLHPHLSLNTEIKRRFVNEASAASRADHENIVQVFDGGVTEDGLCYVVMELLRGTSLSTLIQAGPMSVARTANIGVQVGNALAAAHHLGIVHRDLKPDNILVVERSTNPEFVKVLDFGIAKLRGEPGQRTLTGMWMGTPGYMSPEQWQTLPDIDGRSDLYSLGVILYQCLTGALPFLGNTPYEWQTAHLSQQIPDPGLRLPMPPEISLLVMRLLAKGRDDRPKTAAEVVALLHGFTVVTAPRHPAAKTLLAAPSPLLSQTPQPVPIPPPRGRSPGRLALGGALLAGLLGAGAWFIRRPAPAPAPTKRPTVPLQVAPPDLAPHEPVPSVPPPLPAELVLFEGGQVQVGDGKQGGPRQDVEVRRFAIGKREVSFGEFREFAVASKLPPPLPWDGVKDFAAIADLPVNQIPREQAQGYCRWRYGRWGGRLPSEAEWQLAATDGEGGRRFPWGASLDQRRANVGGKLLAPVSSMPEGATQRGLLHMIGNVAEWTSDDVTHPIGRSLPQGAVIRGGALSDSLKGLTATSRRSVAGNGRYSFVGFRCAAS